MASRNRLSLHLFLPELEQFRSGADRRRARDKAYEAVTQTRSYWRAVIVVLVIIASLIFVGPFLLVPLVGRYVALPEPIVLAIPGPVIAISFGVFTICFYRQAMRRNLREMLAARGVAICIECGYNLHGLTDARCPECGRTFSPMLPAWGEPRGGRPPDSP